MGIFDIFRKKESKITSTNSNQSNQGNQQNSQSSLDRIVKLAQVASPNDIHSTDGAHEASRLIELVIPSFGAMLNVSSNSFITASMLDGEPQSQLARIPNIETKDLISLFRVIGILAGENSDQSYTMVYGSFQNAIIKELQKRNI